MKEKIGYTLRKGGLVADRNDGLVCIFSNDIGVEEVVKRTGGRHFKEGDDIYLAPPDRVTGVKLHLWEGKSLSQQLRIRRRWETDRSVLLAKGILKTLVNGQEVDKPLESNIIILRKKKS
jgi:hypothetical protein